MPKVPDHKDFKRAETPPEPDGTPGEKRRARRQAVNLPALLGVLIPEDTFQPVSTPVTICNLSLSGLMVRGNFSRHTYLELLKKTRYCRVFLNQTGLPVKLTGKAVWIQPEEQGTTMWCRVGLFFESHTPDERTQLDDYISKLSDPEKH
jgi:hypothetical protein